MGCKGTADTGKKRLGRGSCYFPWLPQKPRARRESLPGDSTAKVSNFLLRALPSSLMIMKILLCILEYWYHHIRGFPGGSSGKELACQCRLDIRDACLIFLSQEDPLEKGRAIHSSILAWRIPWTEEPGGL